ncbi:MAG: PilZ domain-containing protein [Phycisphaerales bacterium]|nr:PilZ domain-containing protein [Phycisphaerales bacterium]
MPLISHQTTPAPTAPAAPVQASPAATTPADRRHHPRLSVQRAAKVLCNQSQRFLAAVTEDLSVGGARVRVESQRPFAIGDSVKVGIAWSQSGIIRTDQLIEAKVVRVDPVLALADAAGATSSPISGPAIRLGLAFAHAASSATPAKAAA